LSKVVKPSYSADTLNCDISS